MKKLMVLRILSIVCMVIMTLAVAGPAYADEPVISKYVLDSWYTKTDLCSFPINVHETGLLMDKKWYDGDILAREMYTYAGNIYYLTANGKTVTVKNNGTIKFAYVSPLETQVTITGQSWVWVIPGMGMVSGTVGSQDLSYIYNTSGDLIDTIIHRLVGKAMATDVTPLLCGYLAP